MSIASVRLDLLSSSVCDTDRGARRRRRPLAVAFCASRDGSLFPLEHDPGSVGLLAGAPSRTGRHPEVGPHARRPTERPGRRAGRRRPGAVARHLAGARRAHPRRRPLPQTRSVDDPGAARRPRVHALALTAECRFGDGRPRPRSAHLPRRRSLRARGPGRPAIPPRPRRRTRRVHLLAGPRRVPRLRGSAIAATVGEGAVQRESGRGVPRSRPPVRLDDGREYGEFDEWLHLGLERIVDALAPPAVPSSCTRLSTPLSIPGKPSPTTRCWRAPTRSSGRGEREG